MDPVGWAAAFVAAVLSAFYVLNVVIDQAERTLRRLKGVVREAKSLRREIKKPDDGEN